MENSSTLAMPLNPFLRWAGSKTKLLPRLMSYYQETSGHYIEPFVGSAALFFRLSPNKAVLGDINAELIETYRQLQRSPREVAKALGRYPAGKTAYYQVRKRKPSQLGLVQRAARFIYLNRFCFNGIYRTNRAGGFNVPYGGIKSGAIPSYDHLSRCSARLRNADLISGDFSSVLRRARKDDFVYMDPPFCVKSRRVFKEYSKAEFANEDVQRLRRWLMTLHRRGTRFLVSYALSAESKFLARGFYHETVRVQRNIAGFAGKRKAAYEMLISNIPTASLRS